MNPGIYRNISNEDYHRGPGISNSGLGVVAESPSRFYAQYLDPNRPPAKAKAGQLEGTLAHCAILEPDEFDTRYVVGPDINRNTKVWKEFVGGLGDGVAPITREQYDTAMKQAEQVRRIPFVKHALSSGLPEVSAYWVDDETGVLCRCRPDWVYETERGVYLLDVKTYSSAEADEFARQIARKGYARQDAMYSDGYSVASGLPVLGFVFIAVESSYPFSARCYTLDDDSADAGYFEYREALNKYAACLASNDWGAGPCDVQEIRLPDWYINKSDYGADVKL